MVVRANLSLHGDREDRRFHSHAFVKSNLCNKLNAGLTNRTGCFCLLWDSNLGRPLDVMLETTLDGYILGLRDANHCIHIGPVLG